MMLARSWAENMALLPSMSYCGGAVKGQESLAAYCPGIASK